MPDDKVPHKESAMAMLEKLDEDKEFLRTLVFSEDAIFDVSGKINKQSVQMGTPFYDGAQQLMCSVDCTIV
jgi:hypothetical protein